MENNLIHLGYGSTEYCNALAEIFSKFKPEECHGGYIPSCIEDVIRLLRESNFESARDTFIWESDKMAYHRNIVDLGKVYFNE